MIMVLGPTKKKADAQRRAAPSPRRADPHRSRTTSPSTSSDLTQPWPTTVEEPEVRDGARSTDAAEPGRAEAPPPAAHRPPAQPPAPAASTPAPAASPPAPAPSTPTPGSAAHRPAPSARPRPAPAKAAPPARRRQCPERRRPPDAGHAQAPTPRPTAPAGSAPRTTAPRPTTSAERPDADRSGSARTHTVRAAPSATPRGARTTRDTAAMPKNKTHSGAKKRFRVTGTGKVMREQAGGRHLLEHKSSRRTRRIAGDVVLPCRRPHDQEAARQVPAGAPAAPATRHRARDKQGASRGTREAGGQRPEEAPSTLERASGYRGQRSRLYRKAKEQVTHSLVYAYRDRARKQGDFRRLWIQRINAASREQRHDLQPAHPGPQGSPASRSTARSSPTSRSTTRRRSTRSSRSRRPTSPANVAAAGRQRRRLSHVGAPPVSRARAEHRGG